MDQLEQNLEWQQQRKEIELHQRKLAERREYRLRDKEAEDRRKAQPIIDKVRKAKPGEEIDFSRRNTSGLTAAELVKSDMVKEKKMFSYKTLKFVEDAVARQMVERGMVQPAELTIEQEKVIGWIRDAYERYLLKYNCNAPEFSLDQVMMVNYVDQFGVGGMDSFLGNNIYLTQRSLQPSQFARTFAHEYGHYISSRSMEKLERGFRPAKIGTERLVTTWFRNLRGKYEVTNLGHTLINEGVTDWFSIRIMEEAGFESPTDEIYMPYREAVRAVAEKIGDGDFDKGLDYFIEAYLTGNDEELIKQIDRAYAKQGGYAKFIDLLNHVAGYAGTLNNLERFLKNNAQIMSMLSGINFLPIEKDRHYKKLMDWAYKTDEVREMQKKNNS